MNYKKYKKTRIACYTSYVSQAITVNLAPLLFVTFQNKFSFSLSFIASITLITFLIQIFIDSVLIKFVEKTSFRVLAVSSQAASFLGLGLLSLLPYIMNPEVGVIIAVLVYSSGSGLSEVVLSPIIESLPTDESSSGFAMTLMHSFYSWGQAAVILVTTLLLRLFGSDYWWLLPLIWALIPLANSIAFLKVPLEKMTVHDEEHGVAGMMKTPLFLVCVLLMICAGASEQSMAQWASMFAEKGLGISKVMGDILGPCLFAVMMAIGRTLHGIFGKRYSLSRLLMILSSLTVACYAVTVFIPVPFMSLLGCGICGVGVSIMWPGMLSLCSAKYPGGGASMFAILALGGDIGCSLGPWVTGTVSDFAISCDVHVFNLGLEQSGLRVGFLASMIFPILMVLGTSILIKSEKIKNEKQIDENFK